MLDERNDQVSPPRLMEGSIFDLGLASTLGDLSLYEFQMSRSCLGTVLAQVFERYPLVPGVILVEDSPSENSQFLGMISRRQLLEFLIRPHAMKLFLQQPLHILYSYARTSPLILSEDTPIVSAAQQALRRLPEFRGDPILVEIDPQSSSSASLPYRLLDVHELYLANWQIRGIETQVRYERMQTQIIQIEKMASLGRLVDGVAHEILDPVGFIWGNLSHLSNYSESLIELISAYEAHFSRMPLEIQELKEEIEFEYIKQDIPQIVKSIQAGAERLKVLATSLQNFCYIDEVHPKPADIHTNLESILLLLKSRISTEIRVIKNYDHIPPVSCYIGQLNQVFMNILINAIDALISQAYSQEWARKYRGNKSQNLEPKPTIEITTEVRSPKTKLSSERTPQRWVSIRIADNGPGMSLDEQQKIIESFSTEKRIKKETSLAQSYQIVTAKHGGQFLMQSEPGLGTEFEILLPLV
ncbi:sensor histidine kinase [Capilliphycus salinus ALCB114379]|uniref:sensor histidine kinase n=1 Tax=Capilliphycus salinus TaxID=2768948 RepID=UPI0039A5F547